ncbi:TonB-dependent siderophore receptor [Asaia siamensis]|uniref:Iron transport outer membrane receptor n=1 Tax=Asaia siamensis TaxID=110479 RepID=A0ABQ1L7U7_9PROT|nr:TonB-dependent siderophore receptor [Asaia siamensis]GBR09729.1 outer membrane receptor [Asaia siamensis NRIC 0323]GGC19255.1 iron transport outer membrane receptor [Asaia siamensis]
MLSVSRPIFSATRSFVALCLITTALSPSVHAAAALADTTSQPASETKDGGVPKASQGAKAANYEAGKEKAGQEHLTVIGKSHPLLTGPSPNRKFTASLLDTPSSVSVVTKEQMKLVNATSFEDAMRTVPGVSFRGGDAYAIPGGNYPVIRGFGSYSNMFIDGLRDSGVSQREVFDVEEMEVLKGPGSVYGGRGGLGGQINITSKKAQLGNLTSGQIGFGTAAYKRGTIDINRQIGSSTAFRLNAMGADGDTAGRAPIGGHRWGVSPSLAFGLGTKTRLTLGYYHLYSFDMPDYSAPYSKITHEPLKIPRSTVLGLEDRDFERSTTDLGQIILERDLFKDFMFRNTLQWTSTQYDYIATNPQWQSTAVNNQTILLEAKSGKFHTDNFQEQAMVSGTFDTGPIHHAINTGIELSRERLTRNEYYVVDSGGHNLRNGGPCTIAYNCISATNLGSWSAHNPWLGSYTLGEPGIAPLNTNVTTGSAYAFDTMSMLRDHLLINGGVRFDRFMTSAVQGNVGLSNNQSFINYQAGAVYKPIKPVSLYFSYATASNPVGVDAGADGQIALSTANNKLAPQNGKNIEVGAKADLFNGRFSITSSLFDGKMTNAQVSDGYGNQIDAGTQRVRGAEINVAGSITPKWEMFGGWTYLDSTVIHGGPTKANVGKRFPYTPGNSIALWSTYKILPRLKAGGGLTYMSKRYTNVNNQTWVPGYVRLDMVADYQITRALDLQANLQNLTNKRYYDRVYVNYSRIAAGRAVTCQLTLRM